MNVIARIKSILNLLDLKDNEKTEIIVYGYTDLMLSEKQWLEHVNHNDYELLDNRKNFEKLKIIHGRPEVEKVPTWESVKNIVFKNKVNFTFVDFELYEGTEILIDLNNSIPDNLVCKYDLVLDLGTSEHIFNYPQVLINSHLFSKPGGFIYHEVPLNWPNHGFYSISPTLFYDFYSDNKATAIECTGTLFDRNEEGVNIINISNIPMWERFNLSSIQGREINICFLAQKKEHVQNFVYPIQRKYRTPSTWK